MKKISKDILENSSYQDIAKIILKEIKGGETTLNIFKEICNQLDIDESRMEEEIGDFYTALTIDRRFIMLEDGKWDLKSNYTKEAEVEEDDDEEEELIEEEEKTEEEEETIEEDDVEEPIDDDIEEDELADLVIIKEEDLEE